MTTRSSVSTCVGGGRSQWSHAPRPRCRAVQAVAGFRRLRPGRRLRATRKSGTECPSPRRTSDRARASPVPRGARARRGRAGARRPRARRSVARATSAASRSTRRPDAARPAEEPPPQATDDDDRDAGVERLDPGRWVPHRDRDRRPSSGVRGSGRRSANCDPLPGLEQARPRADPSTRRPARHVDRRRSPRRCRPARGAFPVG